MVQILQQEGPQYGYNIKKNNGFYLLGRCHSIGDAIVAKADLENSLGRAIPNSQFPDSENPQFVVKMEEKVGGPQLEVRYTRYEC